MRDWLFPEDEMPKVPIARKLTRLTSHISTQRKALLVRLYLQLFVYVTHRGTYIDAFAGPQDKEDAWAARHIWESDPGPRKNRIDRLELFEQNSASVRKLEKMVEKTAANRRAIAVASGDCNIRLPEILQLRPVKGPAFCLLDQRSTECDWQLVKTVAEHKQDPTKIEIFYFLMARWKNRSLKNISKNRHDRLLKWWGREDYGTAINLDPDQLAGLMSRRFREELGYKFAYEYPIYEPPHKGGYLQYFMIHASDHPEATSFMNRAYNKCAGGYDPRNKQADLIWSDDDLTKIARRLKTRNPQCG